MPAMHELTEALTDTHQAIAEAHKEHVQSAVTERQESIDDAAQVPPGAPSLLSPDGGGYGAR